MNASETMNRVLQPLCLSGGAQLPNRILPGPMEGVMTRDFCQLMMEFDLVSVWITPFIRILDNVPRQSVLKKRLDQYQGRPMIVQLMGTNRQTIVAAAQEVSRFEKVIAIEVNCACPSSKVLQSGAGSALLQEPQWIRDTLLAIRDAVPDAGVGVKIRSGLNSPDESEEIIGKVSQARPDYVVMHYRTAGEMYRCIPGGWQRFGRARSGLGEIPLFASGDLLSVEACCDLLTSIEVDGITPARGLLKNPWLLREVEASLRGTSYEEHDVTPFLIRLIELGRARVNWRSGNVLDIARMAWGEETDNFQKLTRESSADGLLRALEHLI